MPAHPCLFRRLAADTDDPAHRPVIASRIRALAASDPALSGCTAAADVVARCLDRTDREGANQVLGALISAGVDDLYVRRLALAALAPGLAAVSHRMAARWRAEMGEVDQAAATLAWELLGRGVFDRTWPAQATLSRVARRLRWSFERQARHVTCGADALAAVPERGDPTGAVDGQLHVARLLESAVTAGEVSALAARVVWATRVEELTTAEVGQLLGRSPGSVRVLRARAERALQAAG